VDLTDANTLAIANITPCSVPRYLIRASMAAPNPHPPMVTLSMPYPAGVAGPQELVGFKVSRAAAMCSLLLGARNAHSGIAISKSTGMCPSISAGIMMCFTTGMGP